MFKMENRSTQFDSSVFGEGVTFDSILNIMALVNEWGTGIYNLPGIKTLGSGMFGIAYSVASLGENYVLKLSHDHRDSYPTYARFCMANKGNNPHFTDIVAMWEYTPGKYAFILRKYSKVEFYDAPPEALKDGYASNQVLSFISSICREGDSADCELKLVLNYPELVNASLAIHELKSKCCIDIHNENVMYDEKNKCLVITDPVSTLR